VDCRSYYKLNSKSTSKLLQIEIVEIESNAEMRKNVLHLEKNLSVPANLPPAPTVLDANIVATTSVSVPPGCIRAAHRSTWFFASLVVFVRVV